MTANIQLNLDRAARCSRERYVAVDTDQGAASVLPEAWPLPLQAAWPVLVTLASALGHWCCCQCVELEGTSAVLPLYTWDAGAELHPFARLP